MAERYPLAESSKHLVEHFTKLAEREAQESEIAERDARIAERRQVQDLLSRELVTGETEELRTRIAELEAKVKSLESTPAPGQLWRVTSSGRGYRVVRRSGEDEWLLELVESAPGVAVDGGRTMYVGDSWFVPSAQLVRAEVSRG